jgi:hypothetical protein
MRLSAIFYCPLENTYVKVWAVIRTGLAVSESTLILILLYQAGTLSLLFQFGSGVGPNPLYLASVCSEQTWTPPLQTWTPRAAQTKLCEAILHCKTKLLWQ